MLLLFRDGARKTQGNKQQALLLFIVKWQRCPNLPSGQPFFLFTFLPFFLFQRGRGASIYRALVPVGSVLLHCAGHTHVAHHAANIVVSVPRSGVVDSIGREKKETLSKLSRCRSKGVTTTTIKCIKTNTIYGSLFTRRNLFNMASTFKQK